MQKTIHRHIERRLSRYIVLLSSLSSMLIAIVLLGTLYPFTFYLHESGHILFGTMHGKLFGYETEYAISNWETEKIMNVIPIIVPQQTVVLQGRFSSWFIFGGSILIMGFSTLLAALLRRKVNSRWVWGIPAAFLFHELTGNYLCGTDNLMRQPYAICQSSAFSWLYPKLFLMVMCSVIAVLLYPKVKSILLRYLSVLEGKPIIKCINN